MPSDDKTTPCDQRTCHSSKKSSSCPMERTYESENAAPSAGKKVMNVSDISGRGLFRMAVG